MTFRRALGSILLAASSTGVVLVACDDSSASPDGAAPDGSIGVTLDGSSSDVVSSGDGATQVDAADSAPEPVDSGPDVYGTGTGLRVMFVGSEHTYGPENEHDLHETFNADTSLIAGRTADPTLNADFLANVDVLVLDRITRTQTADEVTAVDTWVRAGHGVIAFGGFGGADLAQPLLAPFGISRGGANLGGGGDYTTMVATHPVANGVSSLRVYGDQAITVANDAGAPFALFGSEVLGTTVVAGKGRVLTYGGDWVLFNVEVNRVDTDGGKPTQIFWHNALLWAGGRI